MKRFKNLFCERDLWDFHNAIFIYIRELIVIVGDFQCFIDCFWWYWYLIKFMVNIPLTYGTVLKISRLWANEIYNNCISIWHEDLLLFLEIIFCLRQFCTKSAFYWSIHFLLRQPRTQSEEREIYSKWYSLEHWLGFFAKNCYLQVWTQLITHTVSYYVPVQKNTQSTVDVLLLQKQWKL